jgi:hypothetical protein
LVRTLSAPHLDHCPHSNSSSHSDLTPSLLLAVINRNCVGVILCITSFWRVCNRGRVLSCPTISWDPNSCPNPNPNPNPTKFDPIPCGISHGISCGILGYHPVGHPLGYPIGSSIQRHHRTTQQHQIAAKWADASSNFKCLK